MLIVRLRIDSQFFILKPDEDVEGLKDQVLAAARGVADFIVFTPVGHGRVSVLMTPHTPVRFEEQEHSEEELAQWESEPPDIDYWLEHGTE